MPIEDLNKPATCAMQRVNEFSKILHLEIDINNKLWLALARVLTGQLAQQPGAVSGLPLIRALLKALDLKIFSPTKNPVRQLQL